MFGNRSDALQYAIRLATAERRIFVLIRDEDELVWLVEPYSYEKSSEQYGETRYILPGGEVTRLS